MNIERMLNQTAVYWQPPTKLDGDDVFGEPIEICCRWEDKREKFVDVNGQEKVSNSIIYTTTKIEVDGQAFEGDFSDLSSADEANPILIKKARPITQVEKMPGLRGGTYCIYKGFL